MIINEHVQDHGDEIVGLRVCVESISEEKLTELILIAAGNFL